MVLLEKFIRDTKIDRVEFYDYLLEADNSEITDFLELFNDIINQSSEIKTLDSGFNFIANSTLSGLPFPCESLDCRLQNIDKLARNAILYSDSIYLQNPFEQYLKYKEFDKVLRENLISDLIILHFIRPLLKIGLFKLAKSKTHFCHDCYVKFQEEYLNNFNYNLKIAEEVIEDSIYKDVTYTLIKSNGKKAVQISGSNDFLDHPIIINFKKYTPKVLAPLKLKKGGIQLSPEQIKSSGLLYYLLGDILKNITIQDYYSKYYSAHILTNRELDLTILNLINKKTFNIEQIPRADILKNIDHFVPYIGEISLKRLIDLRKNEGESFQVYRDKINSIVKMTNLDGKDYSDIFKDEIQPELNRINQTIKNNRKHLWNNVKSNIFLASTYITATLYSGVLPSNINEIVAAIGGFSFAQTIGQDVINLIKQPAIRENELYFLWKINQQRTIKIA